MHAHETILRSAYLAFAKGDIPAFAALCAQDIEFRVPGDGLLSGHHTMDAFFAKLGPAMQAVSGSFREEVTSVATNDDGGVVLAAQQAERDGIVHRWNAVHWWKIRNGKLAEFHEFVDDAAAFERAWHR
jgi:ketosteroid isomerase-like protein